MPQPLATCLAKVGPLNKSGVFFWVLVLTCFALSADDYSAFVQVWNEPADGLHGYLLRFVEAVDATFQHIAVWTIVQLLESGDARLDQAIRTSERLISQVHKLIESSGSSTYEPGSEAAYSASEKSAGGDAPKGSRRGSDTEDESEDEESDGEIAVLAKKILDILEP